MTRDECTCGDAVDLVHLLLAGSALPVCDVHNPATATAVASDPPGLNSDALLETLTAKLGISATPIERN